MKRDFSFLLLTIFVLGYLISCAPRPVGPVPVVVPLPVKSEMVSEDTLLRDARSALEARDDYRAYQLFGEYLSRFPNGARIPEVLMQRGMLAESFNDLDHASADYQRIISEYPHSIWAAESHLKMLAVLSRQQAYDKIIEKAPMALSAVQTPSKQIQVYQWLGDAYLAKENYPEAIFAYAKAYDLASSEAQASDELKTGINEKMESAVDPLDRADLESIVSRMDPGPAKGNLLFLLGNRLMAAEQYVDAQRVFSDFVETCPDDSRVMSVRETIADLENMAVGERTIGCLLPLTGPYSQFGLQALNGVEFALNQFTADDQNAPVRIIVKDTGADPQKALAAFWELANTDVRAIIGPMVTAGLIAEKAQELGIPMIAMTQKDGVPQSGDYIFRNFITPRIQTSALADYAVNTLGVTRFAILYPAEKYGITFMHQFWDQAISHGGKLTKVEAYEPGQTDFADVIKKLIKRYKTPKAKDTQPVIDFEAIFIPDGSKEAGLLIPQLAFHDIRNVYLLGTNRWYSPALINMAKSFVQGGILPVGFFPDSVSPAVAEFVSRFENDFGQKPGFIEAVAYDTAMILFQVMGQPGMSYRSAIRDSLLSVSSYPGLTGLTTFREDGDVEKQIDLLKIIDDRFVELAR